MEVVYSDTAKQHLEWWRATGNVKAQKKIMELIDDIKLHPATGIGKPELLKHALAGTYSRRINAEHRLTYQITEETVFVLTLKGHYE